MIKVRLRFPPSAGSRTLLPLGAIMRAVRRSAVRRAGLVAVLAAAACSVAIAGSSAGPAAKPPAHLAGCSVFPAFEGAANAASAANQTAWNQDVSHSPVAKNSKRIVRAITKLGGNQVVHPDFGGNGRYGIPYTTVGRHQKKVRVKVSPYGDESDFGRAPIPRNAPVEGGSDRHVLVMQRGTCKDYELYAAHYLGGKGHRWHAASTALFNFHKTRLRHAGWTSADAAGLAILPGLVRYGEVKHGPVHHALRATFEETRAAYIKPATHFASSECNRFLPSMGMRFRLKHPYFKKNLHRFPKGSESRTIFTALYHYGIINADNGGPGANWFIGGARSKGWHDGDLNRLKSVPGKAFAVVRSAAKPVVSSSC
jgi:hypothetical protein